MNDPDIITDAHRKLAYEIIQMDDRLSAFAHRTVARLIAQSEERLSSENKALRQSLRECGRERLEESIRADSNQITIDHLLAWRESALELEKEWDQQAIAKMLGGRLGDSCRKIINERVPLLILENKILRAEMIRSRNSK